MKHDDLIVGEQKKRFYELVAAIIIIILLWLMARLETRLFEITDFLSQYKEFVNTLSYFALINVNVILILLLSFLLFRNIVRLVIERKRGVIGSKLKTKLVIALVFFALAPSLLLVYVSTQFITQSFVGWFSDQVTETIKLTREAGEAVYKQDQKRVKSLARISLQSIEMVQPDGLFFKGHPRISVGNLKRFTREYGIDSLKIYRPGGAIVWTSQEGYQTQIPYAYDEFVEKASVQFLENSEILAVSSVVGSGGQDVVRGAAPLFDPVYGNLVGVAVAEERFESQLLVRLENVLNDFARLKPEAQLIRLNYMIIMILMMLLIVFSAIWLGFYVAKGITGPLQSLAEATREVALGNYSVSLRAATDDETGQLVRAFNVMTKDLEKHEAETKLAKLSLEETNEELSEKSQNLEVVLKSITAGVISLDEFGRIVAINKAAENLLMVDAASAEGRLPKSVFSEKLYSVFWEPLESRIATGKLYQGQVDLSELGREAVLIVRAVQIVDDEGKRIGGVVVVDDAQDEVRAQKVAAWKEVAKRMTHEIKNTITPTKLNAQRIQRRFRNRFEGEDKAVFNSCIESILVQVDQLRDLVNKFSSFSKLPDANLKDGAINKILGEVFEFYSVGYSEIDWVISLDKHIPVIAFDQEQLRRVFVNLIANSVESFGDQKDDGAVDKEYNHRIEVESRLLSDVNSIRLEVRDNGPGIPNNLKRKVQEPYVSTKSEGTGLGLAIVGQIVADHGGYLRIIDNEPKGTVIAFELPIRDEASLDKMRGIIDGSES
jgi:two-component system, NtrC family, nitrogen regulation sensor histidine kinase NtrY